MFSTFPISHHVNVRLKLNTPLMLRWAWGGWGGVGMWTFVCSWTRHWCYAEHGVGWGCERSFEVEHATVATLSMGWGGVGMLTFVWSWTRHWCYAEHGVGWGCERSFAVEHAIDATLSMGWGGVGWGGDVNVRLQLNTPLVLRWAWGGVGMWTFVCSWTRHWCYAEHGVGWGC